MRQKKRKAFLVVSEIAKKTVHQIGEPLFFLFLMHISNFNIYIAI